MTMKQSSREEKLQTIDPPEWSDELLSKLSSLKVSQRRAILMIVTGEAAMIPLSRLLKTSYSCCWCGRSIGRSGESNSARKSKRQLHESQCASESNRFYWSFVASSTTYYNRWRREPLFVQTLDLARQELAGQALLNAAHILHLGSTAAARKLVEQITVGEKDIDQYRAAVAVLDRAAALTADKSSVEGTEMKGWLKKMREEGEDALAKLRTEANHL